MAARGGGAQRSNVIPREKLFQFKLVLVGEGKGREGGGRRRREGGTEVERGYLTEAGEATKLALQWLTSLLSSLRGLSCWEVLSGVEVRQRRIL